MELKATKLNFAFLMELELYLRNNLSPFIMELQQYNNEILLKSGLRVHFNVTVIENETFS